MDSSNATPDGASPDLMVQSAGSVLTLTLNRPEKLNSLTANMLRSLEKALRVEAIAPDIRVVVLTGAGRGFCAGQDLHAGSESADAGAFLRSYYHPVVEALAGLDKPVVAAVNGVAAGAGVSLALACDFRIAAASATFVQAFVRIGLVPDAGSSWFLPRLVGISRALELSMLGDSVSASDALRIGLVGTVVPDSDLGSSVRELAMRLGSGPASVGLIKQQFRASLSNSLDEQLELEAQLQTKAMVSEDAGEGLAAFREKREPRYSGR